MFAKIKSINYWRLLKSLQDVRVLGLLIFATLVLLVSWSIVQVIQTNYDLQKKISKLQQETVVAELENNNLKLKNQYYQTDSFIELAARRQFGKAAPGEALVLIPKTVALAYTVEEVSDKKESPKGVEKLKSKAQQNREAWLNFFLHR